MVCHFIKYAISSPFRFIKYAYRAHISHNESMDRTHNGSMDRKSQQGGSPLSGEANPKGCRKRPLTEEDDVDIGMWVGGERGSGVDEEAELATAGRSGFGIVGCRTCAAGGSDALGGGFGETLEAGRGRAGPKHMRRDGRRSGR